MLEHIIEIIFAVGMVVLLYEVFISDSISDRWQSFRSRKEKASDADKIAKVKLVSDDAKDIEKFINTNAHDLSDAMVTLLVARIESLHDNQIILDDSLKKRIENIQPSVNAACEDPASAKKARK